MHRESGPELEFVYTPLFETSARRLLTDDVMRGIELALLAEPRIGDLVAGSGGVRKIRAPLPGRGKRGGARVIYLYLEIRHRIYFLLAYAKNDQMNLTADQKGALQAMVRELERSG